MRSLKRSGKKRQPKFSFQYARLRSKYRRQKRHQKTMCAQMNAAWNPAASVKKNVTGMGLVYDVNERFPAPSTKAAIKEQLKGGSPHAADDEIEKKVSQVVESLEAEKEQPSVRRGRLSQSDLRYVIYLMEKYGEDYEAMAKDAKNVFQDSPGQIRQKIERFKKIPVQYNAYLRSRGLYKEGEQETMETE